MCTDLEIQDALERLAFQALGMATYALDDKKVKEELGSVVFSGKELGLWFGLRWVTGRGVGGSESGGNMILIRFPPTFNHILVSYWQTLGDCAAYHPDQVLSYGWATSKVQNLEVSHQLSRKVAHQNKR